MEVLESHNTWVLVYHPLHVDIVGCKWIMIIKYHFDGIVKCYKARLIAKRYTQTYDIDFLRALIVKFGTICLVLSVAVHSGWNIYRLHVKNVLLCGDLLVYMQQPLGFEC